MAISVQPRGTRFQLRVTHRLLHKPFFFTFDAEVEARNYGQQLKALLDRGIVPAELLGDAPKGTDDPLLVEAIRAYVKSAPITDSDDALLGVMLEELVGVRVSGLTFHWADGYVRRLKIERNLAPGSIRKRVGVLGRVIDWHLRRATPAGQIPPANALRLLPKGYSTYTRLEAFELESADNGKVAKRDEARDRRLTAAEDTAIEAALAGVKRDDRERALEVDPAFQLLYRLILETGLRLREAYRLRVDQIDLERGIINVEGSKGHRGVIKPRHVPLKPALASALSAWCKGRIGLLFPFWNGDSSQLELRRATGRLSARFRKLFEYAGVAGCTEHDLRHEATCRWVELRGRHGGWAFSDVEVCRIMGWTSTDMMLVYASLRGEDLAARLG
jgi:integrase